MKGGWPPTAPNARAGLLTPPGITLPARSKAAMLLARARDGEVICGSSVPAGRRLLVLQLAQLLRGQELPAALVSALGLAPEQGPGLAGVAPLLGHLLTHRLQGG